MITKTEKEIKDSQVTDSSHNNDLYRFKKLKNILNDKHYS